MKQLVLFLGLIVTLSYTNAQMTNGLYKTARGYLMQGDLDNAIDSYNDLLRQDPNNIYALNDYCYILILEKEYVKAIELGKKLIANPKADEQSYQTFGMAYKGNVSYKEAENLYQEGLKKFPRSGVLYNEFGELYAMENKFSEAILKWEGGIKADPNYSNNYFNATMYYSNVKEDLFWVIQYGEIFINLESYSTHTDLIKLKLLDAYKKMFTGSKLDKLASDASNTTFQKAWYNNIVTASTIAKDGLTAELLGALRIRFILNWYNSKQNETTPFTLFEHLQYLIKQGLFDAYNQWVFGETANPESYQLWLDTHAKEASFFKVFQQNRMYKQPVGEYYK